MPDRPTPDTILQEALDLVGPEERAANLDEVCADDAALCNHKRPIPYQP